MKLKFLIVGCGSIGLRHLACLCQRNDVEVATFDQNKETKQKVKEINEKIKFYQDLIIF